MTEKEKIEQNKKLWDAVHDIFTEASALPALGPFDVGKYLNLIPKIKNKTFLEIGCGSGRSIKYLIRQGAKKVYGIDFSQKQLDEAKRFNKKAVENKKVILIQAPMEKGIKLEPIDVVFSVYGIGWTQNPKKTFANIYSYLKPNGRFIWSWDHSFFTDVVYENGKFVVKYSYHNEKLITLKNWRERKENAHITYLKIATWFQYLTKAGFDIIGYYEPKPENLNRGYRAPKKYYSIQKAEKVPSTFIFVCQKNLRN